MIKKYLKIVVACSILIGLLYWDYLDMMHQWEPSEGEKLLKSIIIQFNNLWIDAKDFPPEIFNHYIKFYQFTQEMKVESCNIQIMYGIRDYDANLIVHYCHEINYPVPTLTSEELSIILHVPVDIIKEIQNNIDNFMSQNPSDQEIQEFIKNTSQNYFPHLVKKSS
jgi:hypothetical protein